MESALVEVEQVAEAAAVARPHPVKGECLYCFVTLNQGEKFTAALITEMKNKGNVLRVFSIQIYCKQ